MFLLLFLLASCQTEREVQELSSSTQTPTAAAPAPTEAAVSATEPAHPVPTITTQTPEVLPAVTELAGEARSEEVISSESMELCGRVLPLTIAEETPAVINLPTLDLADAGIPVEVWPALRRLLSAPETVGLAAFEVGQEAEGLFLNQDLPLPLASVVKIINLIAYARAVEGGLIDPSSWIEIDELNEFYLPRADLGAHQEAMDELEEETLIAGDPPALPMEEIPRIMIEHSSNAAADYLHMLVGQEQIEKTAIDLGLESHTAPCPWIGQFLVLANHERVGSHRSAVQEYVANSDHYAEDVMAYTRRFSGDKEFRDEEIAWRRRQPSFDVWELFTQNLNAHASAGDYANLLSRIATNQLDTPYVNLLVRRALEWPDESQEEQNDFAMLGYKGGTLPGVLTSAYYGQRQSDGRVVVVALFFSQLPRETYQSWLADGSHNELARWLMMDEEAISFLAGILGLD